MIEEGTSLCVHQSIDLLVPGKIVNEESSRGSTQEYGVRPNALHLRLSTIYGFEVCRDVYLATMVSRLGVAFTKCKGFTI